MEEFLPSYDDPIVSILLLLGIVFLVSVATYLFSIYKQNLKEKELRAYIENFGSNDSTLNIEQIKYDASTKKPLFLLALAYSKSGDYSKSINIYLYLLKHSKDYSILKELASSYFKAGFLQRALDIYLEILHNNPRDKESLYNLEFIYEKLNRFDKAYEVLDVLEAQDEKTIALQEHIELIKLSLSGGDKFNGLILLYEKANYKVEILREMFKLDARRAFSYYSSNYFEALLDLLYRLDSSVIDLEIVNKDTNLKTLYYVKGYLDKLNSSDIFSLNILANAKESGFNSGGLGFRYFCKECKSSFPLDFKRCPSCHKVYSREVIVKVEETKRY